MNLNLSILCVSLLVLSSCASPQTSPNIEREKAEESSTAFKQENPGHSNLDEIDLKWKARGLQAKERLEKISAKKKKTAYDLCVEDFEAGFAAHAEPKVSSELKKDVDGDRVYILAIVPPMGPKVSRSKDIVDMSMLAFNYDKSGALTFASLAMLAKGWIVAFPKDDDAFLINNLTCSYVIYPYDPLKSTARVKTQK